MTQINRNAPCTCGSGKKFKKCCGAPKERKTLSASVITPTSQNNFFASRFSQISQINKENQESAKEKIPQVTAPN